MNYIMPYSAKYMNHNVKKIIVYGTAYKAKRICHFLQDDVEIVAFTETECKAEHDLWNGEKCIPLEEALLLDYTYIVIASNAYCEITSALIVEGVPQEKIIQAFNAHRMFPNTLFYYDHVDGYQEKGRIFESLDLLVSELY